MKVHNLQNQIQQQKEFMIFTFSFLMIFTALSLFFDYSFLLEKMVAATFISFFWKEDIVRFILTVLQKILAPFGVKKKEEEHNEEEV